MRRRRHRPASQRKQLIAQWQDSDLSVSQFCRDHEIPTSAFYRWKVKFSKQESPQRTPFIQVVCPTTKDSTLELAFPAGHVLRFTETTSQMTLVSIVLALKEAGI